jgi:hypothetical protein
MTLDHYGMSQYFTAGDVTLWNPANRVGWLFLRTSEAVATLVDMPTGIGPDLGDEHELSLDEFVDFVDALVAQYLSSSHPILRALLEGFVGVALVLVERAGRDVPSLRLAATLDSRDISVGPEGIRPLGSVERLVRLADEHALAMPH